MSSFLSKFKGSASTAALLNAPPAARRDANAPQPTALEKLLADAGPVRQDGSDKIFGMENFGSTCYYNSIIQCLYHTPPFREYILNFPTKSTPPTPLPKTPALVGDESPFPEAPPTPAVNGLISTLSPMRSRAALASPTSTAPKKPLSSSAPSVQPPGKEENKDSPEYKKKTALANGPIIHLDQASGEKYSMQESMFTSLKDMFEAMVHHESRTGVVSPQRATDLVRSLNSVFSAPMHQDAHECLNFVLNEIVEDLQKYKRSISQESSEAGSATSSIRDAVIHPPISTSWIHDLFEGTMTSETKCLTCQNTSAREEAYLDLSVDLGLYSSVTSCLLKFSEEEMLNERNKFHCDRCYGLQEAEKRMKIKRLPKVLALHLKRFTYTEDLQRLQKLHHRVAYPYYLRLFNLTDDAEDQDKLYELYGVVVHIGTSPYQGHYVSIIKTHTHGWLLFDDENVEPVEKSFVRNFFGNEQGLACAYVLFYKETTYEAAEKDMDDEDRASLTPPPNVAGKESHTNGKTNGSTTNGHYLPPSPIPDDGNFHHLDRSVTAPLTPPLSNGNAPFSNQLEHVVTSPILPFLNKKKSVVMTKRSQDKGQKDDRKMTLEREKEVQKATKERDREAQKPPKEKKKEGVLKWQGRRDLVPAEATMPRSSLSGGSRSSQHQDESKPPFSAPDEPRPSSGDVPKETSNGFFSNSVSRFRQTSKSIKGKPRLWGTSKGKIEPPPPITPEMASKPFSQTSTNPTRPIIPPQDLSSLSSLHQSENDETESQGLSLSPSVATTTTTVPSVGTNIQGEPLPASHVYQPPLTSTSSFQFSAEDPEQTHLDPSALQTGQRSVMARTPTPTALPPMEPPPSESKKKEKRGLFGLGRKKSVVGL